MVERHQRRISPELNPLQMQIRINDAFQSYLRYYLEAFRLLMEVLGPAAYLDRTSVGSVLRGRLEMNYRSLLILTFGGGTNEIQRDLIGMFGLGLPRALRS